MKLRFINRKHEVGNVYSYFFSPIDFPEWQAGQYLNITMPGISPANADRLFSIASAPHQEFIQITTINGTSSYKRVLASLKPGKVVEADQLGGDFVWQDDKRPKLFIAGGIGITPYISIIRDRLHNNLPLNVILLYAGANDKRPFIDELQKTTQKDSRLIIKNYQEVRLTLKQLIKDIPEVFSYTVYLAGSQRFSENLGEGLIKAGMNREHIKYDYFDGYTDIEY